MGYKVHVTRLLIIHTKYFHNYLLSEDFVAQSEKSSVFGLFHMAKKCQFYHQKRSLDAMTVVILFPKKSIALLYLVEYIDE